MAPKIQLSHKYERVKFFLKKKFYPANSEYDSEFAGYIEIIQCRTLHTLLYLGHTF